MIKVAMPVLNVTFNNCLSRCFKILFIIEKKVNIKNLFDLLN